MNNVRLLSTPEQQFGAFVLAITIIRVCAIILGSPNLGPDEGQYWFWSLTPDLGYFSKPPLIAWAISVTTGIFGHSEWAVRLSAPLFQTGAAIFIFLTARRLSNSWVALWSGVAWLTLMGVFLSSTLITTDAPLLFFWSAALFYFFKLSQSGKTDRYVNAAFLGCAVGLGFLSKYAMIYFIPGAILAAVAAPTARRGLGLSAIFLACAVAAAIIAPNIWWNAQHDFQTLSHTAANANWDGDFGHPAALGKFLADQLAVAGPIMLLLIVGAAIFGRHGANGRDTQNRLALLAFALPPFLIVSAQAFISRAHGNWAAVAYPSAVILAVIWALQKPKTRIALKASVILHLIVGTGFLLSFISPSFANIVGAASAYKRLRGWESHSADILNAATGVDAIMTDDREIMGELVYYARSGPNIVAFDSNNRIDHHFEAFNAFVADRDRTVLFVTTDPGALALQGRFGEIKMIGSSVAETKPGGTRTLFLFEAANFLG